MTGADISIASFSTRQNHPIKIHQKRFASTSNAASPVNNTIQDYSFTNLVEMQIKSCQNNKDAKFLGTKAGNTFNFVTFGEFAELVNKFRGVLKNQFDIGVDDKIAMISNNRLEWAVAYYATNSLGAQIVPMYEAQAEKDWRYIINDSEAKLVIVASEKIYEKTKDLPNNFANVKHLLCFDAPEDSPSSYKRLMNEVDASKIPEPFIPTPDHLTVIIYTSGTTGNPKGVELTHHNIVSNILGLKELWGDLLTLRQQSLSFLPWAHVFGLTCDLHSLLAHGSAVAIAPTRETILECIDIIRPTAMTSVPMLFNRVYDAVHAQVKSQSPIKQKIFHAALAIARERNTILEFGGKPSGWLEWKYKLADKIVMSKIRDKMGGNLQYMASGGASVSPPVLQFFEDIGVPICEGYGLTETSPVITSSFLGWSARRLGCVGVPLHGNTVKIMDPNTLTEVAHGEEGEVCCAGGNVMKGYRNNPKANEEVFFQHAGQRFFRTGDLGRLVDGKFLKITGRIKEQYKLENGKYVVPAPIEDALCRSLFVAQVYMTGVNKPYNVGLVVPNFVNLLKWAEKEGFPNIKPDDREALESLVQNPKVVKLLSAEIIHSSAMMKSYERIQKWYPIVDAFTQENGMMTPKMSVRRNVVQKTYDDKIEAMYDNKIGNYIDIHKGSRKPSPDNL